MIISWEVAKSQTYKTFSNLEIRKSTLDVLEEKHELEILPTENEQVKNEELSESSDETF